MAIGLPAEAQPVDFTQQSYTSTLAQIEKADGWYDDVNYGAAAAGLNGKKYFLPDGINLGSYMLYMTLGAGTAYDDNIYTLPDDPVGDFRSEANASVALLSQLPRHLFNVYLDGSYVGFAEHGDYDYVDGSALAEWRLDIDHGHALGGRMGSSYEHEERLAPETPINAREAVPVLTNAAEIALTRDQGRLGASLGLDFADYNYSDVEAFDGSLIDQDFRDMTSYGAYLHLSHRFSPGYKLLASLRAGREIYNSADSSSLNATVYDAQLGLAFELSPLWRAYASAGYGLADYDAAGSAAVRGLRFRWPIAVARLARSDHDPLGRPVDRCGELRDIGRAARDAHRVDGRVRSHAQLDVDGDWPATSKRISEGSLGLTIVYIGKIGAEYTINKNVLFTLGYEHKQRFSTDPDYDTASKPLHGGTKNQVLRAT